MSICIFNSPNGDYSNFLITVAFSNKSFPGEKLLPIKYSHLLTFAVEKIEILAVCLP